MKRIRCPGCTALWYREGENAHYPSCEHNPQRARADVAERAYKDQRSSWPAPWRRLCRAAEKERDALAKRVEVLEGELRRAQITIGVVVERVGLDGLAEWCDAAKGAAE